MKVFASQKSLVDATKKGSLKPCGFYKLYSGNELTNCKAMKDSST